VAFSGHPNFIPLGGAGKAEHKNSDSCQELSYGTRPITLSIPLKITHPLIPPLEVFSLKTPVFAHSETNRYGERKVTPKECKPFC